MICDLFGQNKYIFLIEPKFPEKLSLLRLNGLFIQTICNQAYRLPEKKLLVSE